MNVDDIALTLEYGLGAKGVARLIEIFGSAAAVYRASTGELIHRGGLREVLAEQITRREFHKQAEKELKYLDKHNITAFASTDVDYPHLMREMNDPPHVLYVRGNVDVLQLRCLSMVGTRRVSQYGQMMCDRLVRELAARVPYLCIVSGLAFGVDVNCHRAAMRYDVPTVAVVANALPDVTPAQHTNIARDIVERGGAIVTELHSQSKQAGDFYVPRNRIIAGLGEGTVVVEADHKSGSLSTADFALGYNRTLMAVPGRATDEVAFGVNNLIKSNKAQMVCSGEDVVRAMMWDVTVAEIGEKPAKTAPQISTDARGLLGCFESGNAYQVDRLAELTALGLAELAPLVLELEFAGAIRKLPGGMYQKIS
jgi:DNA processing protein